jgi:hypothetical protein
MSLSATELWDGWRNSAKIQLLDETWITKPFCILAFGCSLELKCWTLGACSEPSHPIFFSTSRVDRRKVNPGWIVEYLRRHGENQIAVIPAVFPCPDRATTAVRSHHRHGLADAWTVYAHQPPPTCHADHRGDAIVGAFLSGVFQSILRIDVRHLAVASRHPRRRVVSRLPLGQCLRLAVGNAVVDSDSHHAGPPSITARCVG